MLLCLAYMRLALADPLMESAQQEILRAQEILFSQVDPAYWIGLEIHDVYELQLQAEEGSLYQGKD